MSILNRPTDGFPPVLVALWRTLRAQGNDGQMAKEELLARCTPPDERKGKSIDTPHKRGQDTLATWTKLGVFTEDNTGLLGLTDPFREIPFREPGLFEFRQAILNKTLENKGVTATDFINSAASLFSLDIVDSPRSTWELVEDLFTDQFRGQDKLIQNDIRWGGFRDWALFLGIAWGTPRDRIQLDPTEAISGKLDKIWGRGEEVTATQFRKKAGAEFPFLDGGTAQKRILENAVAGKIQHISESEFSPAISLAILRLAENKKITIESRSDADQIKLLGPGFQEKEEISHLVRSDR